MPVNWEMGRHNLSPRGDGNQEFAGAEEAINAGHNLSPRGDGNLAADVEFLVET